MEAGSYVRTYLNSTAGAIDCLLNMWIQAWVLSHLLHLMWHLLFLIMCSSSDNRGFGLSQVTFMVLVLIYAQMKCCWADPLLRWSPGPYKWTTTAAPRSLPYFHAQLILFNKCATKHILSIFKRYTFFFLSNCKLQLSYASCVSNDFLGTIYDLILKTLPWWLEKSGKSWNQMFNSLLKSWNQSRSQLCQTEVKTEKSLPDGNIMNGSKYKKYW